MIFPVVATVVLFALMVWDTRRAQKKGAGMDHIDTATGACFNGNHWNCSGTVHYFTKRGTTPCSCPCH